MSTILAPFDQDVVEVWGRPRVVVGGKDVSYFPDLDGNPHLVTIGPYNLIKDAEFGSGTFTLPGIDVNAETPGKGRLDFLRPDAYVRIDRVLPDGTRKKEYRGLLGPWRPNIETGLEFTVKGGMDYLQGSQVPPSMGRIEQVDMAVAIERLMNGTDHQARRDLVVDLPGGQTGIDVTLGLEWTSRWDAIVDILSTCLKADGTGYTIRFPKDDGGPVLCEDVPRNGWTSTFGQPGIIVDLEEDHTQVTHAIYGTGVGPRGGSWCNAKYPRASAKDAPVYPAVGQDFGPGATLPSGVGKPLWKRLKAEGRRISSTATLYDRRDERIIRDVQEDAGIDVTGRINAETWAAVFNPGMETSLEGAFIYPLAKTRWWDRYRRNSSGARMGLNPHYQRRLMPNERLINFPSGTTKKQGRASARAILEREKDAPLIGTITYMLDPQEGSRFDIKVGDSHRVRNWLGRTVIVYNTSVSKDPDPESLTVTVTVSSRQGTFATAADEAAQRRGTRQARREANGQKVNQPKFDWDTESPAGYIAEHATSAGEGVVTWLPVNPANGNIVRSRITCDRPTEFIWMIFKPDDDGDFPTLAEIEACWGGGSPLALDPEHRAYGDLWEGRVGKALDRLGLIIGGGSPESPCGYGKQRKPYVPDMPELPEDPTVEEIEEYDKAVAERDDALAEVAELLDGTWRDDSSWSYAISEKADPYLQHVIWTEKACIVEGGDDSRFLPGTER